MLSVLVSRIDKKTFTLSRDHDDKKICQQDVVRPPGISKASGVDGGFSRCGHLSTLRNPERTQFDASSG